MEELDEFGIPIRKKPAADVDEFGIPIKKKVLSGGGGKPLSGGSDPFRTATTSDVPLVYTPGKQTAIRAEKEDLSNRLKGYKEAYRAVQGDQAAVQAEKAQNYVAPERSSVVTQRVAPLMTGLNNITSSFYKIPRFVYDVFAIPQNLAAELTGEQSLGAEFDNVSGGGAINPLGVLDRIGDYSKEEADKWEVKKQKFDEGVTDQISKGKFADAGLQILDNVVESAPTIASIYMTGGAANAGKLSNISRTIGNALPFASMQNQNLQGNDSIPDWLKPVNASLNGLSEILLEERFGTKAILDGITRKALEEGKDQAVKSAKDFILSYAKKALQKVQPVTDVVSNGLEEGATTLAQNLVARATGEDTNRGYFDGVTDAMIVGSAQGAAATSARGGIDYILKPANRAKVEELEQQRAALSRDLDDPNVPDDVKEKIGDKVSEVNVKLNEVLETNRGEVANATPEQIAEIEAIETEIGVKSEAMANPELSEVSKTIIAEDLKTLESDLKAKIKEAEKPVEDADEITSPETLDVGETGQSVPTSGERESITADPVQEAPLNIAKLNYEEEDVAEPVAAAPQEPQPKSGSGATDSGTASPVILWHEGFGLDTKGDAIYLESEESAKANSDNAKPYIVSLENPFTVKTDKDFEPIKEIIDEVRKNNPSVKWHPGITSEVNRRLKEQGYDGLIIEETALETDKGYEDIGGTYGDAQTVVFDKSKIKKVTDPDQNQSLADGNQSLADENQSEQILAKAEDDLTALKKVADKPKKYEASMKRLSEAKAVGAISDTEFNGLKQRFDDVIAESSGKLGDKLRKLADIIDDGKINKPGQFAASTGFDAVWDGSLTVVSASLRAGAKVADAIEAGLDHIRKTEWYKNLKDKPKFEDTYRAHMAGQLKDKEEASGSEANKEYASASAETRKTEPAVVKEVNKKPVAQTQDPATQKRAATQRVLESDKYSQEFKDALTDKTIHYKELPNQVTDREAEAIIETQGEAAAIKATQDFNNGMPSAVRFSVLQKLIDRLEERGEHLQAAELAEELYSKATDYGQGIQIFSTFPKLSKTANVALAKKTVAKQREAIAKRAKPVTTKITKEFKKANEEAAKETVEAVKKSVEKATRVTSATMITDLPAGYGTRNKVFTRDKYLKAKQNLRKSLHSFALGVPVEDIINIAGYHMEATGRDFARFTRRMKADLGAKVKPYLKDIYGQTRQRLVEEGYDPKLFLSDEEIDAELSAEEGEKFKNKLDKAIAKKSAKEQKQAIAKLQEISKEEGLWGQYRDSAAKRLKSLVKTNIQEDISGDPSLQQFIDGLVKNMRQKMAELQPEQPKTKAASRPDIEVIGDAYKNLEKYKDVWEKTQQEFQEKYADDPDILDAIDGYFGEILDKPFSDRILESAVRKGLKDMGNTIADLVVQHYTVVDHAMESLKDKLINEAGLGDAEGSSLAREIERKFDEIATKKKQQILDRMFSKKTRKANQAKGVDTELIKLTNLGGFTNAQIVEAYGDKMGWPKLTQENIARIEQLSDIIQNTKDPINKRRATEDLLAYQASLKGTSPMDITTAIWYMNVLSGYKTQEVNFGWNLAETILRFGNAVAQNPKDAPFIAKGLLLGLQRGLLEGKETFNTGYSPIKSRPEIPPLLERITFKGGVWNPANYLKYVRRAMVAVDVMFFEGGNEMRAHQMAKIDASKEGKINPTLDQVNRALEIVGRTSGQLDAIEAKYESEHNEEVARINSQEDLSDKEKASLIKALDSDKQRKIFDAIEQQRSPEMVEESRQYAAEGTLNFPPKGLLGATAHGLNSIIENVPVLRYAVPFTNIIANAANIAIDYSPLGFLRLRNGGMRLPFTDRQFSKFRREDLTDQQRADLMTRAIIATGLMTAAMVLSQPLGDDDEPFLEITSNGTGDYAKNETLKRQGWQQYSFRVKLPSGKYSAWYSYQYTPFIFTLGFVGHFNDLLKYKKVEDKDSVVARLSKAAGLATTTLLDATYLSGLGDLLSATLDPRSSEGMVGKTIKGAVNAVRSLILPNLITQAAQDLERIFDVNKKEIRDVKDASLKDYVKYLMGKTLQDIPYARNLFYDKINILGDPVKYDTDKFMSDSEPDKIIQLLVDKKAVFAPMNRNAEKIYDTQLGRERALTDEEFYQYSREKGAYIKKVLTDEYDKYSEMGEEKFGSELSKIKTKATKAAKALVGDIPATTLEIKEGEETYELSPVQIQYRLQLIEQYVRDYKDSYDDPVMLRRDAQSFSKDQMLSEGYAPDAEGKFKLEIKD